MISEVLLTKLDVMKKKVLFSAVFVLIGLMGIWGMCGCSDKSVELKSDNLLVTSVNKDSVGHLDVQKYEICQESQLQTKSGSVVEPSVTLFYVDGKLVTKEKYVEVFNNYSKQGTIDFIGQDTVCFNCKTQL